jgi:hypothetical protein
MRLIKNLIFPTLCFFSSLTFAATQHTDHISMRVHASDSKKMNQNQNMNKEPSHKMSMHHGMFGPYTMMRESSGTSWQPDSTPMFGVNWQTKNGWENMLGGFAFFIYDHQGSPRGGTQSFSTSMLMFMTQKDFSIGTLGFKSMFSLDPLMGAQGYPLIFQTGETADGRTHLVDRQHPHDAVMELAGTYSIPFSDKNSVFLYVGLPGEPALGPPAFMHRWSGMDIPEAPLSHHWLDATHVTFGVVTAGLVLNQWKLEGSVFNGREPDQSRWNIESPQINSQAIRLSFNPNENWSAQVSAGRIKSPELLDPEINIRRNTASVMYNKPLNADDNWQTTLAWGQNINSPGHTLNAYLLESTVNFSHKHTFFGRLEHLQEDELLHDPNPYTGQVFNVNKLSLGYIRDFAFLHNTQLGIGALASTYAIPGPLQQVYGQRPFSYMLFARIKIV